MMNRLSGERENICKELGEKKLDISMELKGGKCVWGIENKGDHGNKWG